jgi:fido (protein-threonine AMPylation protein)
MEQLYTVNRLYIKGRATAKVVLSQSNQGSSEKEAIKYGKLIEKKEVFQGVWVFAGLIRSETANASKVTEIGGADDTDVLRRTGIDVCKMGR